LTFDINRKTQQLEEEKTYKYLGIEKSESTQAHNINKRKKERMIEEGIEQEIKTDIEIFTECQE
jgi:IS4 transposase